MPAVTRAAPTQSMRSRCRVAGTLAMTIRINATIAIGMLIQKIARQVHCVR